MRSQIYLLLANPGNKNRMWLKQYIVMTMKHSKWGENFTLSAIWKIVNDVFKSTKNQVIKNNSPKPYNYNADLSGNYKVESGCFVGD